MIQVNCNLDGKFPFPPTAILDENGHRYSMMYESSTRGLFFLNESADIHPWGVTGLYGNQSFRFVLQEEKDANGNGTGRAKQGAFELTELGGPAVLHGGSSLARINQGPEGFTTPTGDRWVWRMMTGFMDYQLWFTDRAQLKMVRQQAKDLGFTGRRVLGMAHFIQEFGPQTVGEQAWLDNIAAFADDSANDDMYLDFNMFADNQIIQLSSASRQRLWHEAGELLLARNHFVSLVNEGSKNGIDYHEFGPLSQPASYGSEVSDTAPPMPGIGRREFHDRRDMPKVYIGADDGVFVRKGLREVGGNWEKYAPEAPLVFSEPIGAAEVDIEGRRSTNPELFRRKAKSFIAFGDGGTFHAEDAIYSRPLGPIQQVCGRAFAEACQ